VVEGGVSEGFGKLKSMNMEFQINENSIETEFLRLAELLLWRSELVVNEAAFNFIEIEFYFYAEKHQDAFTHNHNESAGRWRFHNQGFDITLRGETGFGGILIRGVERNGKTFNGPRRVLFELMSHLNPVTKMNNAFGIQGKKETKSRIFRTFRHGLKNPISGLPCDRPDYYRNLECRFIVHPQSFDKSQFQGSEAIARGWKDSNLSYEFLGYNLKQ
jgi:hypothetical protein